MFSGKLLLHGAAALATRASAIDRRGFLSALLLTLVTAADAFAQVADPLPSWNEGAAKQAILSFVDAVTRKDSPDFVPPAERTATFDNDGTLWVEQPMYVQLAFAHH